MQHSIRSTKHWVTWMMAIAMTACSGGGEGPATGPNVAREPAVPAASAQVPGRGATDATETIADDFRVEAERFADVRVLRYRVPGFEELPPRTKELLYYFTRPRSRAARSSTTRSTATT